jgi:hypothetical protein
LTNNAAKQPCQKAMILEDSNSKQNNQQIPYAIETASQWLKNFIFVE